MALHQVSISLSGIYMHTCVLYIHSTTNTGVSSEYDVCKISPYLLYMYMYLTYGILTQPPKTPRVKGQA